MAHLSSHTRTFPSVICPLNNSHSFVSSPEDTIAFHHVFCALTTALRAGLINPEDGSSTLLRNSNLYFHYIISLRCSYCSFWPTSCVWHYKHAYGLALRRSAICYGYCGPCLLLRTTHPHPHGPPTRGDASARQTGQRLQGDHIFATIFRFFSLRPLSFPWTTSVQKAWKVQSFGRLVAGRTLTVKTRFRSHASPCGIYG